MNTRGERETQFHSHTHTHTHTHTHKREHVQKEYITLCMNTGRKKDNLIPSEMGSRSSAMQSSEESSSESTSPTSSETCCQSTQLLDTDRLPYEQKSALMKKPQNPSPNVFCFVFTSTVRRKATTGFLHARLSELNEVLSESSSSSSPFLSICTLTRETKEEEDQLSSWGWPFINSTQRHAPPRSPAREYPAGATQRTSQKTKKKRETYRISM
jgi:hypothetical protein